MQFSLVISSCCCCLHNWAIHSDSICCQTSLQPLSSCGYVGIVKWNTKQLALRKTHTPLYLLRLFENIHLKLHIIRNCQLECLLPQSLPWTKSGIRKALFREIRICSIGVYIQSQIFLLPTWIKKEQICRVSKRSLGNLIHLYGHPVMDIWTLRYADWP